MLNFIEYSEHFRKKIQWCKTQIQHLRDNFQNPHGEAIAKISEYQRDCHSIIRRLDLLRKKYPDFKMPNEVYDEAKGICMYTRFYKLEILEDYLKEQNIRLT
jgi:hypothetical protein